VAAIEREVGKLKLWPVSLVEFADLKSRVGRFFAPEQKILPGADIGPIEGKGRGKFGDFAWLNPWTVLVREAVAIRLKRAHIQVTAVKCNLDFKVGRAESLFEIEALPVVRLAPQLVPRECELCGRVGIRARLKKSSLTPNPTTMRDQYNENMICKHTLGSTQNLLILLRKID
jgi:hypothetical protein